MKKKKKMVIPTDKENLVISERKFENFVWTFHRVYTYVTNYNVQSMKINVKWSKKLHYKF